MFLNNRVNALDAIPVGGRRTLAAVNTTTDAHDANVNLHATSGLSDHFFTTTEVGKGTGRGLSTSMAIGKSHGGFVRAYSEMGRGSNFNLHIPTRVAATNDVGVRATVPPEGRDEPVLVLN